MQPSGQKAYHFEGFTLDLTYGGLHRADQEIELRPKSFETLRYLVENAGRLVPKDELASAIWRDVVVADESITRCISDIRLAIGDSEKRLIRTVPRRGYRFVATVSGRAAETSSIKRGVQAPGNAQISVATESRSLLLPERPSIAVLPFQNMTGDPEQDYFVDGMVEEITTAIARFPELLVIARNSAFAYKGKAIDVRQVARELGVRYALEGSVRKTGNRVRITGQLIDTTTATHIWADRFDGALDDVFEFQDRVASNVAVAIEPKLRLAEISHAYRKPTESLDAYDLYLRSMAENFKRTKESLEASVRFARKALELDPDYAPAMARLALSLSMQRVRGWIPPAGPEVEEGIRIARRAIAAAADNQWTLTNAGLALANLNLVQGFDAALAAIDRAIAVNPNSALTVAHRALVLSYRSEHADDAVRSAERALSLSRFDPAMFPALMALAAAHFAAGRYETALPWAVKAKRANGGLPAVRLELSLYGHLGREREAADCLRELREITPEPTIAVLMRDVPPVAPDIMARLVEGWRKAGIPED